MSIATCRTCKWWISQDKQQGECRRHAPQVTVILVPQPTSIASKGQPTMQPMPIAAFPPIGSPDHLWCGEYEPSVTLLQ
jgi:hypothetical protein